MTVGMMGWNATKPYSLHVFQRDLDGGGVAEEPEQNEIELVEESPVDQ